MITNILRIFAPNLFNFVVAKFTSSESELETLTSLNFILKL